MSLTNKALFVIERNLGCDLSLEEIARRCGVSRYHLAHAFGDATGVPVVEYLRGRRLTRAAEALAAGAGDILSLALESGYGSHEAFSRAFKSQFGATPEDVRKATTLAAMPLVEPMPHLSIGDAGVKEPRFERAGELRFVGLGELVSYRAMHTVPGQWQRFMAGPYDEIENKLDEIPTGLTAAATEDGIEYVCAAGVSAFGRIPKGCAKLTLAPASYAVFSHEGHVTRLRETYAAIWNHWFPSSAKHPAGAPSLERHNDAFDPATGNGGLTIWIPIRE